METSTLTLFWYDYLIFILVLLFCILIGIYFGCFTKNKQSDPSEYLQGRKKMNPLPVAVSLVASSCSTSILLSFCSEVYSFGASILLLAFGLIGAFLINRCIFLPVFYNLEIATAYEYLEKRFNKRARQFASGIFTICCIFFLSVTIYTPALALSAVTGFQLHYVVLVVSSICIFYTSIGGFKTVIWTDVLQFFVVLITLIIILVLGIQSTSGFNEIWQRATSSGRLDIFEFDSDPTRHDSFWIIVIGYTFNFVTFTCVDQIYVQKFRSIRTFKQSTMALLYFLLGHYLVIVVCVLLALTMYAKYSNCDPVKANFIQKPDQLLPYFAMDVGNKIPGISGIFIASVFSSGLSLQSAILNCLSGSVYSDFISKIFRNIPKHKESYILKLTVLVLGILCTALVFLIQYLSTLFKFIFTLVGVTGGPIFVMFSAGLLFPKINSKGAFFGTLLGFLICLCIALPATYFQSQNSLNQFLKPVSIDGCPALNQTFEINNASSSNKIPFMFRISYFYYSIIGASSTIISGLIISYLTNKNSPPVDKKLISPVVRFFLNENDVKTHKSIPYSTVNKAMNIVEENSETPNV